MNATYANIAVKRTAVYKTTSYIDMLMHRKKIKKELNDFSLISIFFSC